MTKLVTKSMEPWEQLGQSEVNKMGWDNDDDDDKELVRSDG